MKGFDVLQGRISQDLYALPASQVETQASGSQKGLPRVRSQRKFRNKAGFETLQLANCITSSQTLS